ncbi:MULTISPECIES: hypothetical protein [unclassified Mesorhizobium]|uniref:hypothetical protein n=1 Tax=unclassified Mesorhizobium TaxID=325217 RepID=UPI0003CE361B|nr:MULTISPECIES: hypothetical protein [unclassified Mesorhizobium]ESX99855.1 hypothetical protein X752_29250 [Mesorhizobium sp. LNJC398B00]ESY36637.1 hypothetical protein X746_28705 [Mesorhizobium sp. LNJC380A00]ESZ24683.1 hypothetical protein X732_33350 [Mesorhizobium sp. L2C066B000]
MSNVVPIRKALPRVEVVGASGEWVVRIIETDQEITRSFGLESFALSFAEGQRIRLHLDKVVRL